MTNVECRMSNDERPMMNDEPRASHVPPSALCISPFARFLSFNALALVLAAVWLRGHSLGNIPGVNGDEAWYGVQAWRMLHGGPMDWNTPTGNPLSPFFVGPLALLHLWLPPSILLLRCVALAGGMAALAVNWLLCSRVFGRRTAVISTVALAVLPINIAFSRFAWDASQSLAATLPVLYFALAAVRYPRRFGLWISASILALAIAFWIHPTNVFAGAAIPIARAARRSRRRKPNPHGIVPLNSVQRRRSAVARAFCLAMLVLAGALFAIWFGTVRLSQGPLLDRIAKRLGNGDNSFQPNNLMQPGKIPPRDVPYLFARLFTGGTVYRSIADSRPWFEWPLPKDREGWGLDVGLFWLGVYGSAWLLWRSWRRRRVPRLRLLDRTDGALLATWALQIAAFLVFAGPAAISPNQERFAICLIGPTVLLLSRGATLAYEAASTRWRVVLAAASLAGWFLLADFHAHYFQFIERTGGEGHLAFCTAAVEPKQAALQYILRDCPNYRVEENGTVPFAATQGQEGKVEVWIVCSQWWNLWPIRYLASADPRVCVVFPKEVAESNEYQRALAEGRVWFVEFRDTDAERQVKSQLAGRKATCRQFYDYGGRPLLSVFHAAGP
jgi:hypothetical protein